MRAVCIKYGYILDVNIFYTVFRKNMGEIVMK